MSSFEQILADPVLVSFIAVVVIALVYYQRTLSWPEYSTLRDIITILAPRLNKQPIRTLSRKGLRDDPEYIATINQPVKTVWKALVEAGGSPHLIASVKFRVTREGERQYSRAHVVWKHADTDADSHAEQSEAYLFDNGDGSCDIYAHAEGWVTNPEDHLTDGQQDGDPKGVVRDALADSSL